MARRVNVRGIILLDGKLLCARLKHYENGTYVNDTDYWSVPGGGLDEGESLLNGIKREMLEETGIEPVVGNLLYLQQFLKHGVHEQLEFFFHILNAEDYVHIDLAATTHGLKEIAEIGFIEPAQTYVLPKFLASEDIAAHIAKNAPPKIVSNL